MHFAASNAQNDTDRQIFRQTDIQTNAGLIFILIIGTDLYKYLYLSLSLLTTGGSLKDYPQSLWSNGGQKKEEVIFSHCPFSHNHFVLQSLCLFTGYILQSRSKILARHSILLYLFFITTVCITFVSKSSKFELVGSKLQLII